MIAVSGNSNDAGPSGQEALSTEADVTHIHVGHVDWEATQGFPYGVDDLRWMINFISWR